MKNIEEIEKQIKSYQDELANLLVRYREIQIKLSEISKSARESFFKYQSNPTTENKDKWLDLVAQEFNLKNDDLNLNNNISILNFRINELKKKLTKKTALPSGSQPGE